MMSALKFLGFALLTLAALQVSACKKHLDFDSDGPASHGRFVGVGIYTPGAPWSQMTRAQQPADASAAQLSDDQAIIVVTDSSTGEVRACGDLSGYCVAMNPWRGALANEQLSPVRLAAHQHGPQDSAVDATESDEDATPQAGSPKPSR